MVAHAGGHDVVMPRCSGHLCPTRYIGNGFVRTMSSSALARASYRRPRAVDPDGQKGTGMYSFEGDIRYSEVDEDGVLTIPSMTNYLQDCALFHSEAIGRGAFHAREVHLSWLVSAWEIQISRLPRFTDHVVVSTWATQFKGIFARRNFTMVGADGAELVRADSQWFMYDDRLGRPVRAPREELAPYDPDLANDVPLDMPPLQRQIRLDAPREAGVAAEPVVVARAHIDTNHHVNNAQYIAMAFDALPENADADARWLEVQYCTAARLGDTIYPHVYEVQDGHAVTLDDAETGGRPYAVVRVRR